MDLFFVTLTWLGSLYILLPLSVLLCVLLLRHGKKNIIFLGSSMLITIVSAHVAKLIFQKPRPSATELLVTMPSDWSFPSAHAAQSSAFFLSTILIAFKVLRPAPAILVALLNLMFIGIVGYSRIYLKVHFVSDVVAGVVLAALIVSALWFIIPLFHGSGGNIIRSDRMDSFQDRN